MADREKLLELIGQVQDCGCDVTDVVEMNYVENITLADHLIANGVTFGKPLTEYLHPIDTYEGLKGKYLVFKADTGEQVVNCFVLRPDKDTAAVEALRAYAHATDNKTLSNDIYNWVGKGVTVTDNHVGGKWISVKERLPLEEWEYFTAENDWDVYPCLAVVKNNRGGRYVTKMFYTGENFVDDDYVRYTAQVTHWMPLPEPPKGE